VELVKVDRSVQIPASHRQSVRWPGLQQPQRKCPRGGGVWSREGSAVACQPLRRAGRSGSADFEEVAEAVTGRWPALAQTRKQETFERSGKRSRCDRQSLCVKNRPSRGGRGQGRLRGGVAHVRAPPVERSAAHTRQ
jgi:hypothetical protein